MYKTSYSHSMRPSASNHHLFAADEVVTDADVSVVIVDAGTADEARLSFLLAAARFACRRPSIPFCDEISGKSRSLLCAKEASVISFQSDKIQEDMESLSSVYVVLEERASSLCTILIFRNSYLAHAVEG